MATSTLQKIAYAVAYITFFFGLVSFVLRFYSRIFILKTWGLDDWMAVAVLVLNIVQQMVLHMFLYWGCGLHMNTLSAVQIHEILKWLFTEEIIYYTVHVVIKATFLFFYLHLSPKKTFRYMVFFGMALNICIWIVNIMLAIFQCIPFDEILHPGTHKDATCIPKLVLLVGPSIFNIVADIYILALPISTVLHLQMSMRRKIAVISIIGFGACSVIIACFRIIPILELNSSLDTSYVLGEMVIVAALEIQFAVIAVNLPSVKALWLKMNGGSTGSGPSYENRKGYKLSSLERSDGAAGVVIGHGKGRNAKNRELKGSITRLERGTESEEELFRQAGISMHLPIQGRREPVEGIEVITDVEVSSSKKEDDIPQHGF